MSDNDGKKTLGVRGGPRSGNVKQSFSHGRTKNVVVETKRKRIVKPKPGAAAPAPGGAKTAGPAAGSKRPAGISDEEMERRMKALAAAKERCASYDHLDFLEGVANAIPLADGTVDKAVSVQTFEYIDDVSGGRCHVN